MYIFNKCNSGIDIRLSGGSVESEGRVEVFRNGSWGTVCGSSWSLSEAMVVCKSLGYPGALEAKQSAFFGQGKGMIWMDQVICKGDESDLKKCLYNNVTNCKHSDEAGVLCKEGTLQDIIL